MLLVSTFLQIELGSSACSLNKKEIPGSPFTVAVTPDGTIVPVIVASEEEGLGDAPEDEVARRGGSEPAAHIDAVSPFGKFIVERKLVFLHYSLELKSSPFHGLPQRPEYVKPVVEGMFY